MSCPACAVALQVKHALGPGDVIRECPACGALFHITNDGVRPITREEADALIPPSPACPKCRSTDVGLEATPLIEIFLMRCRDCGFEEAGDEFQRMRWGY